MRASAQTENATFLSATLATDQPWSDLLRLAVLVIPGVILAGITAVVLMTYAKVWWSDRLLARAQGVKSKWRGLLPRHVVTISASYFGLVFMVVSGAVMRFREPVYSWPRTLVYGAFICLGIWSLWSVLGHQRAKMMAMGSSTYPGAFKHDKPQEITDETAP